MSPINDLSPSRFLKELPQFASLHQAANIIASNIDSAREYDKAIKSDPSIFYNTKLDPFIPTGDYKAFRSLIDNSILHTSLPQEESIRNQAYIRMYTVVYKECLNGSHKDVLQDKSGKVRIHGKDVVFWTASGSLHRVLAWFQKYKLDMGSEPLIRSFLVPEEQYRKVISSCVQESNRKQYPGCNIGVDNRFSFNQFGIDPSQIDEFEQSIKHGSLITYGDLGYSKSSILSDYGQYKDITELTKQLCGDSIHIWPIGNPWCFASRITSFVSDLNNSFISCQEVGVLAQLGNLIYESYVEFQKLPKLTEEQKNDMEMALEDDQGSRLTHSELKSIKEYIKNYGRGKSTPLKRRQLADARATAKWKNSIIVNYIPGIGQKLKELRAEREKMRDLIICMNSKWINPFFEKNKYDSNRDSIQKNKVLAKKQKNRQLNELKNSWDQKWAEFEGDRTKLMQEQKQFYCNLISLGAEIQNEYLKNGKKVFYFKQAFLELIMDILRDVLSDKGFSQTNVNVAINRI
jgi:hypothetical protein